jgi:hypothetical protein
MTPTTFFHLLSFLKDNVFDLLQVPTHGLSSSCRVAPLDGREDFLMTLEGPPLSFFRLKIPLAGLSQKVEKGKQKAFEHPVSGDPGQTVMEIGIGSNRVRTAADFLSLFLEDLIELDDFFRGCIF